MKAKEIAEMIARQMHVENVAHHAAYYPNHFQIVAKAYLELEAKYQALEKAARRVIGFSCQSAKYAHQDCRMCQLAKQLTPRRSAK